MLEDEVFKHIPKHEEYIDILRNLDSLVFTKDDFVAAMQVALRQISPDDTFEAIMRSLFDFSLVGYYAAGGSGGGSDYVWRYKDNRAKFNDGATQFKVHPGFKEVLGLKKFTRTK